MAKVTIEQPFGLKGFDVDIPEVGEVFTQKGDPRFVYRRTKTGVEKLSGGRIANTDLQLGSKIIKKGEFISDIDVGGGDFKVLDPTFRGMTTKPVEAGTLYSEKFGKTQLPQYNIADFQTVSKKANIPLTNVKTVKDVSLFQPISVEKGVDIVAPAGKTTPQEEAVFQKRVAEVGGPKIAPEVKIPQQPPQMAQQVTPQAQEQTVVVKSGDTLSKIARQFGVSISDITGYRSGDPNLIYPGERLTIKKKAVGVPEVEPLDVRSTMEQINQIDTDANIDQENELNIIEETTTGEVDVSKSSKLIKTLVEEDKKEVLPEAPEPPSMTELFNQKRQELGIEPLENELNDIDSQIEEIESNLLIEAQKAGERLVPMGQITRRKGKLQTEAEQRIQQLNIQRNSIARRLDSKMNTLSTIIGLTEKDFDNASQQYQDNFDRQLTIYKITKEEEDEEKQEAQANLDTIINIAQESGKNFEDLTPEMKRNIKTLELKAGLPSGTIEAFLKAKPQAKIISTTKGTDAQGNDIVSFIYQDPETGLPSNVQIVKTGGVEETEEEKKSKSQFTSPEAFDRFSTTVIDAIKKKDTIFTKVVNIAKKQITALEAGLGIKSDGTTIKLTDEERDSLIDAIKTEFNIE